MSVVHHAGLLAALKGRGFAFEVFYDVGANIGRWSVAASKVYPDARYELFEPLAGKLPEVDSASLVASLPGARLHDVALSDVSGPGEIKVLGDAGVGSSILVLEADRRKDLRIVPCEFRRMDDIVAERGLPQPDFIKLDAQAAELRILKGAVETLRKTKFVLCETWARRVYGPETPLFHELAGWLYAHEFVPYDVLSLDEGRDADGTLRWFDAVFINKAASGFPRWQL